MSQLIAKKSSLLILFLGSFFFVNKTYATTSCSTFLEISKLDNLQHKLEKQESIIGRAIGSGGQFRTYTIKGEPDNVIKRLFKRPGDIPSGATLNSYFESMKNEHELALHYFGSEFVPDTRFFRLSYSLRPNVRDADWKFPEGHEYIMVQKKVRGIEISEVLASPPLDLSPQLRVKLRDFVHKWRVMQKDGFMPEFQFLLDPVTSQIGLYDTNHIISFRQRVNRIRRLFFDSGLDPNEVEGPQQVLETLLKVPEFEKYKNQSFQSYRHIFDPYNPEGKKLLSSSFDRLKKEFDFFEVHERSAEISGLFYLIRFFPPEGDVFEIKQLIDHLNHESL